MISILLAALAPSAGFAAEGSDQFQFRMPRAETFELDSSPGSTTSAPSLTAPAQWLNARRVGSTNLVQFGSRVVIQLESSNRLAAILRGRPLMLARSINTNIFVLQAGDAHTAI